MAQSRDPRKRGRRKAVKPSSKTKETSISGQSQKSSSPEKRKDKSQKRGKAFRAAPSLINLIFWILILVFFYWFFEIQLAWPAWWAVASLPIFFIARFIYLGLRTFKLNAHDAGIHFIFKFVEVPYLSIRSIHIEKSSFWQKLFWGAAEQRVFIAYNKYDYARFSVRDYKKFESELSNMVPDLSPIAHFEY